MIFYCTATKKKNLKNVNFTTANDITKVVKKEHQQLFREKKRNENAFKKNRTFFFKQKQNCVGTGTIEQCSK